VTTIASDGYVVAADGLRCRGPEIIDRETVKLRIEGGELFGLVGVFAVFEAAMAWYLAGAEPGKQPQAGPDDYWTLYVFRKDGVEKFNHNCPYKEVMPYPFSTGSGADYAMGALLAGAPPKAAVAIAARLDVHTGGTILEYPVLEHLDEDVPSKVKRAFDELPDKFKRIA
jgi:hypothetical protein